MGVGADVGVVGANVTVGTDKVPNISLVAICVFNPTLGRRMDETKALSAETENPALWHTASWTVLQMS